MSSPRTSNPDGWCVYHIDVKSVFLNNNFKEVHVFQPSGFIISDTITPTQVMEHNIRFYQ
jgi:hypothetical protein